MDGLNVTNGVTNKVYRSQTHNLTDNFVQGRFHLDDQDRFWMTTYKGLYRYISEADDFELYRFANNFGDTITFDYSIIRSLSDTTFLMELGPEVVVVNTNCACVSRRFNVDVQTFATNDAIDINDTIFIAVGLGKKIKIFYSEDDSIKPYSELDFNINKVEFYRNILICCGSDGTLAKYDLGKQQWTDRILLDDSRLNYSFVDDNKDLWVSSMDELIKLKVNDLKVVERSGFVNPVNSRPIQGLMRPFVLNNKLVFIGADGDGVQSANISKPRIGELGAAQNISDVTSILETADGKIFVGTRNGVLYEFNMNEQFVKTHQLNPSIGSLAGLTFMAADNQGYLMLSTFYGLWLFDTNTDKFKLLSDGTGKYNAVLTVKSSEFLVSTGQNYLLKYANQSKHWLVDTVAVLEEENRKAIFYHIFTDNENRIYINDNLEKILVYNQLGNKHITNLPLSGLSSFQDRGDHVLITNNSGLFRIEKEDWEITQIIDKDKKLEQHIYTVLVDKNSFYWLSTNNGLYRYDPKTNHAHQFKLSDGLQGLEYNTNSFLEDTKGRFFFGGQQGLNVFDPLAINLSDHDAPIDFYNYKINDEDSRAFGVPAYVEQFDLYQQNNTITFEFVGIDYDNPKAVNLKYYMEGYDKDWVVLNENDGLARYANLPYGEYRFNMVASNADEVWSNIEKTVNVVVHPPFWSTWWFRSIVALGLAFVVYRLVRGYYNRKLERRDNLLKQQALVIEKQEAVEHERNRIASEMHDDLGSGLTTIKYLSEHALKFTEDAKERKKIQSIADHANTLVSNMSEIIWAMNSRNDTLLNLVGYIRRYASTACEEHNKKLHFRHLGEIPEWHLGGEKRRNLFLITKEILHNFIKHAQTDELQITIELIDQMFEIRFLEIGSIGFDVSQKVNDGNGLYNMNNRAARIDGHIVRAISENGMLTSIKLKIGDS